MSTIKSFSVGKGDMFYINHGSDNFTIIDSCMCEADRASIVAELKKEAAAKGITRFISTHPDDDHIGGLKYLHEQMNILNFYTVTNAATKKPECWTEDFGTYCQLRDDTKKAFYINEGCTRNWMNTGDQDRGSSGINILWPVTSNAYHKEALQCAATGGSPNNISPIIKYAVTDGAEFIWMGDLETDFQEKIQDAIKLPSVDIVFAPHHGRGSGKIVKKWLDQMSPSLVVIGEAPSEHLCYYPDYNCITQNSAGAITFDCVNDKIRIYVSKYDYSVKFLQNEYKLNAFGGKYLGTLTAKAGKKKQAAAAS